IAEAEALAAQRLDPGLPALRAVGVREFADAASGLLSIADAVARARQASRRYAKRQTTWFRTQTSDWTPVPAASPAQFMGSFDERIFPIIRDFLLTGRN
ncbi:MAG: tRNA (adenosine(37)-N6)-dimethylallyltransferase MiaA, partial [Proteobacteria bacterium]|nr:tRNA (adenosine(37)-N6)-dimethylallyltransferase MiaA [Pseudomonadota bacterium]